jgi:hypothetical protein
LHSWIANRWSGGAKNAGNFFPVMKVDGEKLAWQLGLFKRKCKHEFSLDDFRLTGIPELEAPKGNDYFEWCEYFSKRYEHESVTKRVMCPCAICGQVFYAHCGLEVYKYGTPQQRFPKP